MGAVKPADVDRVSRAPPAGVCLLLFYGPDLGRVAERARVAAGAGASDGDDPFRTVRLAGDDLADQPGRLAEEALSFGLFGSRRTIWIKPTLRNIAPAVAACLDADIQDTLVVVEAGNLPKSSPLRALCEKSGRALALPCYGDEARELGAIVSEALQADGLTIDPDARELLLESLGGDRLASRSELAKLIMYVRGRTRVTRADIVASVSDASGVSLDEAVDAAFAGEVSLLEGSLAQLAQHGTAPGALLAVALKHAVQLIGARSGLEAGEKADAVLRSWKGLHFRRHGTVERQLRRWPIPSLRRAVSSLERATLLCRQWPGLGHTLASRALFRLAEKSIAG